MKKIVSLFIVSLLLLGCKAEIRRIDNGDTSVDVDSAILDLSNKYPNSFYLSLYSINSTKKAIQKMDSSLTWVFYNDFLKKCDKRKILSAVDSISKITPELLNKIDYWCNTYEILMGELYLSSDDNVIFFEEVVSEHPLTKHLINQYIHIKGQDWSSLSTEQSLKFSSEVITFVSELDIKQRLKYYSTYFSICRKKLE